MNFRQLQHLAAAMAHEVRNPLNSMAIHVELLEGRLKKEPRETAERAQILKSVSTLQGEIERIDRILDEYLSFAGPEETPRRLVDPAQVVSASVERARALADSRAVQVEIKLPRPRTSEIVSSEAFGRAINSNSARAKAASPALQLSLSGSSSARRRRPVSPSIRPGRAS